MCILYGSYEIVVLEIIKMLNLFENNKWYIVNLGYGVYFDVDLEKVKMFIKIVKFYEINK